MHRVTSAGRILIVVSVIAVVLVAIALLAQG